MHKSCRRLVPLGLALALAGCSSLAPDYKVPPVPMAEAYKPEGPWTTAQPADQQPRDRWWTLYGNPTLNDLQQRLLANNSDLSAALAHYRQAQAIYDQTAAAQFPRVGISANGQRDRQSDTRPLRGATSPSNYNSFTLGATLDYELDVWGRVRDAVASGRDLEQAAKADLASAQLSLQVQLAQSYLQLRTLDQQIRLLRESIDAFQKALELTQTRHSGGIVSGLDVARARTQLSSAKSQLSQATGQRALAEHAIAVLVGDTPSSFGLPADTTALTVPAIPTGVPSALLQRRADIAAAERRTAAATAQIGVARAAYFPTLNLNLQGGYQSAQFPGIVSAPNIFWAIGPTLLLNVLDGGRIRAGVEAARAAADEAGARYRGVVLGAFQQVEDNSALLATLGAALTDQLDSVAAARQSVELATDRYRQGAVGYLDVVQAQTVSLDAQRSLLDLQGRQLRASVELIRALGGGWTDAQIAPDALRAPVADTAPATAASPG